MRRPALIQSSLPRQRLPGHVAGWKRRTSKTPLAGPDERVATVRTDLPEDVREPKIRDQDLRRRGLCWSGPFGPGQTLGRCGTRLRDEARNLRRRQRGVVAWIQAIATRRFVAELDLEAMKHPADHLERLTHAPPRNVKIPPEASSAGVDRRDEASGFFRLGGGDRRDGRRRHTVGHAGAACARCPGPRRWKDAEERFAHDGAPACLRRSTPGIVDWSSSRTGCARSSPTQRATAGGAPAGRVTAVAPLVAPRQPLLLSSSPCSCSASATPCSSPRGAGFVLGALSPCARGIGPAPGVPRRPGHRPGMLVDNAIVVADNVVAHLRLGKDRVTAAIEVRRSQHGDPLVHADHGGGLHPVDADAGPGRRVRQISVSLPP